MSIELCSQCFGSGGEGRKCCGDTAENWGLFAVCGRWRGHPRCLSAERGRGQRKMR